MVDLVKPPTTPVAGASQHPTQRIYMHLSQGRSENFIRATAETFFFHVPGLANLCSQRCSRAAPCVPGAEAAMALYGRS